MKYTNPVKRGFFPDPSIIRVGDDYYMVNSTFQYFPAIVISHSKDLVHWEIIGHAITENSYLDLSEILDSRGIWAPDISYCNGKYYIFATLRYNYTPEDKKPMRVQLVMWSDKPEGPYSKPTLIDVDNIDPSHFVDDDGKHYMVIAPGVCIVPLNEDCTERTGEPLQVWEGTGERCPEGPHIFKKDGYYYALVAAGGTGYGHGIVMARSKNIEGPYESSPYNPILRQTDENAPIQRSGHGKFVKAEDGSWWCTYLCGRQNEGKYTTLGRETALDRVHWFEDGWCVVGDGTPSLTAQAPDIPQKMYESKTYFDFKESIPLEFQWVRNPDYSLIDFKDGLSLKASEDNVDSIKCKNILLHREEELKYNASLSIKADNLEDAHCGLICYYSTVSYIRFSLKEGFLELVINRNRGEEVITQKPFEKKEVCLCVETRGQKRTFYIEENGKKEYFASVDKCIFLCDEGVPDDPKRHTGTLVGMYIVSKKNKKAVMNVNYFKYENITGE
ncbi:MAG: family 43 glycosylhydrolase [Firmicutes bacterium]|nr:family 43 glycosylhydrolase [Bacillota bacterium]